MSAAEVPDEEPPNPPPPLEPSGSEAPPDDPFPVPIPPPPPPTAPVTEAAALESSDDDENYGQCLLEVLSVTVHVDGGRNPSGSVSVFDGKRGQKIYSGSLPAPSTSRPRLHQMEQHSSSPLSSPPSPIEFGTVPSMYLDAASSSSTAPSDQQPSPSTSRPRLHQNELLLTGPYRAISADGCVAFVLNLSDDKSAKKSEILVDLYDPATEYERVLLAEVDTGYGRAEFRYALLGNAVECSVQVKLLLGNDTLPAYAHGTVVARGELLQHDIVLFDGEITRATSPELIIPLGRSVLAVPLMWPLEIKVDLRGPSGEEIVKGAVVKFCPGKDDQLVSRLLANNDKIEVTTAWSCEDY